MALELAKGILRLAQGVTASEELSLQEGLASRPTVAVTRPRPGPLTTRWLRAY
jgi:hypothetical protein